MNYTEIATLDLPWAFANGVTVDEAFNWSEKYHPTKYFRAHGSEPMETDACWKVRLPLEKDNVGDDRAVTPDQLKSWLDASAPYIKEKHI